MLTSSLVKFSGRRTKCRLQLGRGVRFTDWNINLSSIKDNGYAFSIFNSNSNEVVISRTFPLHFSYY
jgi:lipoprotein signal peptidase